MKKLQNFAFLMALIGCLSIACKKDDTGELPPEPQPHTILSFMPPNGPVGTAVTIKGTNLVTQNASAAIGETAANITGANNAGTELYITVPNGAIDGKIAVTIDNVEVKSANTFDVTEEVSGPSAIELAATSLELRTLDTGQFPEITNLNEFENPTINYTSDNESVIGVDQSGVLTALKAGAATLEVTIISNSNEYTAQVMVNISPSEFVVGSQSNGFYDYITVWKNGEVFYTVDNGGNDAYATSIALNNSNDIYVLGQVLGDSPDLPRVGKVWKNEEEFMVLEDGSPYDVAPNDMHISDTDEITIAGGKHNGQFHEATYWVNGESIIVHNGNSSAEALSLYGQDIYTVGGIVDGSDDPTVWNNENELYTLAKSDVNNSASAYSIDVKDGIVYTAGFEIFNDYTEGRVWKNGDIHFNLYDNISSSSANSIEVVGDNIYVGGAEAFRATLWINEAPINLTLYGSEVRDLTILDNFAYVCGKMTVDGKDIAVLWKVDLGNQEVETIQMEESTWDSYASSLFIK